jgi:hypothetical protein
MKLGPYNELDLSRARDLFTSRGIEFEIATDAGALEEYDLWFNGISHAADRGQTRYSPVFIYVQISDSDFVMVRERLIASSLYSEPVEDPMTFDAEYGCPDCNFVQRAPGDCPKHHKELLHFSDWVETRKRRWSGLTKVFALLMVLIFLIGLYQMIKNSL